MWLCSLVCMRKRVAIVDAGAFFHSVCFASFTFVVRRQTLKKKIKHARVAFFTSVGSAFCLL